MSAAEHDQPKRDTQDASFSHDYALQQVPDEKRRGLYELVAVWVGWAISVSAFLVGGVVGNGTTLGTGLSAIFIGNLILVVIGALVGTIGFRTGLTTYSIGRVVFGKGGSVIVSFLLGFLAMGFIGVLLDGFANSMVALVPAVPKMVSVLAFAGLVTLSAVYGYKGLSVLSKIAAPILWILMAVALFSVLGKAGGFSAIAAKVPAKPIPLFTAIGSAVATWLTGAALSSDISRYAKKESHVWIGALGGYILGSGLLEGISVITARGVGNANVVVVLSTLGLLVPGVLVLLLALWTTTDNNIYSSALAFSNAGDLAKVRLSKPVWTIIAVLIAVAVSLLGLSAQFLKWLQFIGIVAAPFAGVIVSHFWLVNKGRGLGAAAAGVRWTAFVTWLAASAFAYYFKVGVPALQGLIAAAALYWAIESAVPQRS